MSLVKKAILLYMGLPTMGEEDSFTLIRTVVEILVVLVEEVRAIGRGYPPIAIRLFC